MAVVKADGYGRCAITVARAAIAAGAERLGMTEAFASRSLSSPACLELEGDGSVGDGVVVLCG
jgi:hypothetical protein